VILEKESEERIGIVENWNKGRPLFWGNGKVKKKPPLTDLMKGLGGLWGFRAKEPVRPIG
jgi:hypothetical protein